MAKRNDINKLFKQRLTDRQTKTRQKTESPLKKRQKDKPEIYKQQKSQQPTFRFDGLDPTGEQSGNQQRES